MDWNEQAESELRRIIAEQKQQICEMEKVIKILSKTIEVAIPIGEKRENEEVESRPTLQPF